MNMNYKIKGYDYLYYTAYIIFLTIAILNQSMYSIYLSAYSSRVYYVCILILLIREIVYGKYHARYLFGIILSAVIVLILEITAKSLLVSVSVVFIILLGKTRINSILRITLIVESVLISFVVVSSIITVIPDIVYYQGDRIRHSLGFRYSLYLPTYFFNIVSIYIILKRNFIKYNVLFLFLLISYLIYYYTDSRFTFYSTAAFVLFAILHRKNEIKKSKGNISKLWLISVPIFAFFAVLSIYSIMNYNEYIKPFSVLDSMLGNRLLISSRSYNLFGFSWFGNSNISWVGQGVNSQGIKVDGPITFVDNLYFNILQSFGIIVLVILLVMLTIMMYRCYKENDVLLLVLFIILAVHGLIDNLIEYLPYNFFLFYIYYFCFGSYQNQRYDLSNDDIPLLMTESNNKNSY